MGFGLHDDRDERAYGGRGGGRAHPYARSGGGGGGGGVSGNRVFVHNLSFKTSWQDLKDHARQASALIALPMQCSRQTLGQGGRGEAVRGPDACISCQAGEVVHAKIMQDARRAAARHAGS